jgi:hypothetical protein
MVESDEGFAKGVEEGCRVVNDMEDFKRLMDVLEVVKVWQSLYWRCEDFLMLYGHDEYLKPSALITKHLTPYQYTRNNTTLPNVTYTPAFMLSMCVPKHRHVTYVRYWLKQIVLYGVELRYTLITTQRIRFSPSVYNEIVSFYFAQQRSLGKQPVITGHASTKGEEL